MTMGDRIKRKTPVRVDKANGGKLSSGRPLAASLTSTGDEPVSLPVDRAGSMPGPANSHSTR